MKWMLSPEKLNIDYSGFSGNGVIANCAFHDDNTPSMFVNLLEGNYYCYSCGSYGSVDKLIDVTGGEKRYVPDNNHKLNNENKEKEWKKFLHSNLAYDDDYLTTRGVTNNQVKKYDIRADKERIFFPFKNNGDVVGVKVRYKNAKNKQLRYITFGKTPIQIDNYRDGYSAFKLESVFVTEGIFGFLKYDRMGYKCSSILSTSNVKNLPLINKYETNKFILALDNDLAGYVATMKSLFLLRSNDMFSSFKDLFDIDTISITGLNKKCFHGLTTNDYFYHLNSIEKIFGRQTHDRVKGYMLKFIERELK